MDDKTIISYIEKPFRLTRNKRTRLLIQKHKLSRLYEATKRKYGVGAYFSWQKGRIIKDSINSASIRKGCNRKFRRRLNRGVYERVENGGAYRKHEDYWWAVC